MTQEERMTVFIDAITVGASVTDASKAAGISRRTAYRWRKRYPAFCLKWDKARVEYDGIRYQFNTLLMGMLVRHRPELYGGIPKYDALARKLYPDDTW